jgi:hypothetical protein
MLHVNWSAWAAFIFVAIIGTVLYIRAKEGDVVNRIAWYLGWIGLVGASIVLIMGIF